MGGGRKRERERQRKSGGILSAKKFVPSWHFENGSTFFFPPTPTAEVTNVHPNISYINNYDLFTN
jgi:hypothetical protein